MSGNKRGPRIIPRKLKRVYQAPGTRRMAQYHALELHLKHSPQDLAAAALRRNLRRELGVIDE